MIEDCFFYAQTWGDVKWFVASIPEELAAKRATEDPETIYFFASLEAV